MKKNYIIWILMIVLISSISHAVCTVTFDQATYETGETIEAEIVCTGNEEESRDYTLSWNNPGSLQNDTGITPASANTPFFETYQIPLGSGAQTISATLTGTNLEGSDSATVTETANRVLIINDCKFKPKAFIGADFSVDCEIRDNQTKLIDNAHCFVYATDQNDAPLQLSEFVSESIDGRFVAAGVLKPENLKEDTSYLAKLKCHCESGDDKCWDEDGNSIENYQGSTSVAFETARWLSVNTLVDMDEYESRQVAIVSANVTNVDGEERLPLHIYYQVRCGESDTDLDRVVVAANPEEFPDKRGIGVNQTQNQGWALLIPEKRWMQGKNNVCYASSEVWIVNEEDKRIKGYFSTSETFNITLDNIGINPDWEISGNNNRMLETRINMSSSKYNDYQPNLVGNMDIRLDLNTPEYTDPYTDSSTDGIILFDQLLEVQDIKKITSTYCNGTGIDNFIEVTNEGFVEIEIRDLDLQTACIDLDVELNSQGDKMVGSGIILFLMILNLVLFIIPFKVQFANKQSINTVWKHSFWTLGWAILAFNVTIFTTMADNAGLGITSELQMLQWIFVKGIYVIIILMLWHAMKTYTKEMKIEKIKKRMGNDD